MQALPLWLRKFVVDFVETALGLVFALALVVPSDAQAAEAQAVIVAGALMAAAVSSARRAIPGLLAWLMERLDVTQ
jgi:uncharacterized membrane protein